MRTIFAKFIEQDILSEMGRLLFFALNTFASNGYHIKLFQNMDFRELEKDRPYITLVESIENLIMVDEVPEDTDKVIYLFDRKDKKYRRHHWERMVQIKFDIFSSYLWSTLKGYKPMFIPYPMHPLHYKRGLPARLEKARRQPKKILIFFSGDTEGYKRNRILYPTTKMTRTEVIDTISNEMSDETIGVTDPNNYNALLQGEYIPKCVIVDNNKFRIESDDWLEVLSQSDFFLCAPGYVMPMCHNVIEAMAVGTIPILNYPEWFNPSLEDGVNCIAFGDSTNLVEKIHHVRNLKQDKKREIRKRVIEYYEKNLDPAGFVKKFESDPEKDIKILMITDACVAKDFSKLGKNSILITGTPRSLRDIWA